MTEADKTIQKKILTMRVKVLRGTANKKEFSFTEPFCIGREDPCQIQVQDNSVSRIHAEVYLREGCWWIRDLNSANGILEDGQKIDRLPLNRRVAVEIGVDGPVLLFEPDEKRQTGATLQKNIPSVTQYQKRYFDKSAEGEMGQHTLFIRKAFERVQKKQKGKYRAIIAVAAVLAIIASGYAVLQHKKVRELRELAVRSFYDMKGLEMRIAEMKSRLQSSQNAQDQNDVNRFESDLLKSKEDYDAFVDKLGVYRKKMSEDEKLIMKMARVFGECELNLPVAFVDEVRKYIRRWQTSTGSARFSRAIKRAKERDFTRQISDEMIKLGLPPQFLYVALQESDFDPNRVGPETDYGYAKGMWMFIPDTARGYSLKTGPLEAYPRYDPGDERHDFLKSTQAAARYIKDLYDRDAQGSGLLVMASYNWSEIRIRRFIQRMPESPRERNFWLLLERHVNQIPDQTYDYVFKIFSAAVIGQNPRYFNFNFDDPLAHLSKPTDQ
jgi:membrane-bound lytic murein transglycosylase D